MQISLVMIALYAGNQGQWLLAVTILILNGGAWCFWGWAGLGHEAYHKTLFRSARMNRSLFVFCGVITWSNYGYFSATHKRHHSRTLEATDPEDQSTKHVTAGELPFLFFFDVIGFAKRIKTLSLNSLGKLPNSRLDDLSPREKREIIRAARVVLAFQASWFGFSFYGFRSALLVALSTLAPWIFRFPNVLLERMQHLGGIRGSSSPFETTRTLILPRLLVWLYAGMNFHVEHHLYPFVPGYRLRRVNELISSQHVLGQSLLGISEVARAVQSPWKRT